MSERPFTIEIIDDGHMARVVVPHPTLHQRKLFARVAELMAVVVRSLNTEARRTAREGTVFDPGDTAYTPSSRGTRA